MHMHAEPKNYNIECKNSALKLHTHTKRKINRRKKNKKIISKQNTASQQRVTATAAAAVAVYEIFRSAFLEWLGIFLLLLLFVCFGTYKYGMKLYFRLVWH